MISSEGNDGRGGMFVGRWRMERRVIGWKSLRRVDEWMKMVLELTDVDGKLN